VFQSRTVHDHLQVLHRQSRPGVRFALSRRRADFGHVKSDGDRSRRLEVHRFAASAKWALGQGLSASRDGRAKTPPADQRAWQPAWSADFSATGAAGRPIWKTRLQLHSRPPAGASLASGADRIRSLAESQVALCCRLLAVTPVPAASRPSAALKPAHVTRRSSATVPQPSKGTWDRRPISVMLAATDPE
jgi:hypothetical protein